MLRFQTAHRLVLVADRRQGPAGRGPAAIRRYRLARLQVAGPASAPNSGRFDKSV